MTNPDSILKSRGITLPTKVHQVKAMVFPVVRYRCESWTIKKAEHWRTDAFELWCWRRLLRVPWTARRSNQSILKEISPEYPLQGWCWSWSSTTLAPNEKNWLIGKNPDVGKDWRQKEKGETEDRMIRWHHQFNGHEFEQAPGDSVGQGSLECCSPWSRKSQTWLSDWTKTTTWYTNMNKWHALGMSNRHMDTGNQLLKDKISSNDKKSELLT